MSASGMTAGVVTVAGDGSYSASPALGPFNAPATATSMAQALFESVFPVVIAEMTASVQAQVVDATTSPPTTNKGRVMQSLAGQHNAFSAALVGYIANHAVATISGSLNLVVPTPNTAGTAIAAPSSAVKVPVT